MGALLLIRNTGPRRGDVTSVLPQDQHPGNAVVANVAGQWAFVYLQSGGPETVIDLTYPKETDYPQARPEVPQAERIKNETLDRRAYWIDLDSLPNLGARTFLQYSVFESATAYRVSLAQLNNARNAR